MDAAELRRLLEGQRFSRQGDDASKSAPAITTTTVHSSNMGILLPLLIVLSSLLFLLVFFLVFIVILKARRKRGIALLDTDGPIDLAREEQIEGEGGLVGVEARWLEQQEESVKAGYERAKGWQQQYTPNSVATEITLSQFLSIQEKGVSAWSFEPDYETNSPLYVTSRTEITFLEDGIGMASQEGGACCVQSNLPLPRLNEVYYWECKIFEKPISTNIGIGLATKPYPGFRMPGWNRYSIGYHSADGFKSHNYPFTAQSYGPALKEGDVLGVGYRPRTGAVFFTRNGKKLEDAYIGLTKHNLFPTVAADGSCTVHVNLGQAGFVFIEANVKKWGLAPMIGTLAPPPAYGSERGSILLESANGAPQSSQSLAPQHHHRQRSDDAAAVAALQTPENNDGSSSSSSRRHTPHSHHHSTSSHRRVPSGSTVPIRPSPLRASMTRPRVASYDGSSASSPVSIPGTLDERDEFRNSDEDDDDMPHNPPTPGQLDISLRSMSPFSRRQFEEEEEEHQRLLRSNSLTRNPSQLLAPRPQPVFSPPIGAGSRTGDVSPPSYRLLDVNQYPAGVAEAMLEAMPEDQFQALFTAAANANTTRGSTASSPAGRAYEGHTSNESGSGLRGLFGGIFRQSSTEQTDQLPR